MRGWLGGELAGRLEAQWGDLREIYESHTTSFFANDPLPKYIRDPEGKFAGVAGLDVTLFRVAGRLAALEEVAV